jgi:pimeloyl-ACP methyl ester carboxylesterase
VSRIATALLLPVALLLAPVAASAEPEHMRPQGPAALHFGAGFPALVDHEWDFALGGFGGIGPGATRTHVPVVFVHGNNVDGADWYSVRDEFRAAGWTDQELFAISYNGLGGNNGVGITQQNQAAIDEHQEMGWDGQTRITNNEVNVADLYDFIRAVRTYTGSDRFSLVTHSLGVTLARRTLQLHPELRPDLVAFVGIAGGNHGTSFCPPGSEDQLVSCNEIAAGTPWLEALNGPGGADETYGPAQWLTVYDGSGGADPAFAGPTYAQSPALRGATNAEYPGTYHNDLRMDPAIVEDYRVFLEQAERPYLAASVAGTSTAAAAAQPSSESTSTDSARRAAPTRALAATGGLPFAWLGALALGLALFLRRPR